MCKVSVIVPVFNVEKYLRQCIESLIEQTLTDIEILLIDDGSPDSSGEICDEYAKSDSRIRVFHKENEGASLSRKYGVQHARGEYICFIDSDDYAENDFLENMYKAISENNADLAECDYTTFSEKAENRKKLYEKGFAAEKAEFLNFVAKNTIINGDVAVVMWNKIYKRSLIVDNVRDYGECLLEDYIFNMQYYTAVNKYVYVNKPLVNYRQVTNSLSRKINPKAYMILKDVQEAKRDFMQKTGLDDAECIEESNRWYIKYTYNLLKNIFIMKNGLSKKEKEAIAEEMLKDFYIKNICIKTENKNQFMRDISEGRYRNILNKLKIAGFRAKVIYILIKMKNKIFVTKQKFISRK